MAVEDNVGDPGPAAEIFHYTPEPFEGRPGADREWPRIKQEDNEGKKTGWKRIDSPFSSPFLFSCFHAFC